MIVSLKLKGYIYAITSITHTNNNFNIHASIYVYTYSIHNKYDLIMYPHFVYSLAYKNIAVLIISIVIFYSYFT